jgi:hypothetical protein
MYEHRLASFVGEGLAVRDEVEVGEYVTDGVPVLADV